MKRLNELGSELHRLRGKTEHFNLYLEMKGRERLKLGDDLEYLWDALEGWVSVGRFQFLWSDLPPFNQKTPLAQWIIDLIHIRHKELGRPQELLGQSRISLMPPVDLQNIQIWRHHHPVFYKDVQILGYFYWGDIFTELNFWQEVTDTALEMVNWTASSATVRFIMKWRGAFQSIEALDIKRTEDTFWTVNSELGERSYLSAISTTHLLNAQLIAQLGSNRLVPVELQNGWLTMALEIARADSGAFHSLSCAPIPESVLQQLGGYLIGLALPGYIEISEHLETFLSKEINRFELDMLKDTDDGFWFSQLQGVLNQLRATRETLVSSWQSL
ncbi:MAG: hypothetical protein GY832_06075 [Chloroflexi bacterium]|nr:hypothetical protein [Chloroflexota bacterium]